MSVHWEERVKQCKGPSHCCYKCLIGSNRIMWYRVSQSHCTSQTRSPYKTQRSWTGAAGAGMVLKQRVGPPIWSLKHTNTHIPRKQQHRTKWLYASHRAQMCMRASVYVCEQTVRDNTGKVPPRDFPRPQNNFGTLVKPSSSPSETDWNED